MITHYLNLNGYFYKKAFDDVFLVTMRQIKFSLLFLSRILFNISIIVVQILRIHIVFGVALVTRNANNKTGKKWITMPSSYNGKLSCISNSACINSIVGMIYHIISMIFSIFYFYLMINSVQNWHNNYGMRWK